MTILNLLFLFFSANSVVSTTPRMMIDLESAEFKKIGKKCESPSDCTETYEVVAPDFEFMGYIFLPGAVFERKSNQSAPFMILAKNGFKWRNLEFTSNKLFTQYWVDQKSYWRPSEMINKVDQDVQIHMLSTKTEKMTVKLKKETKVILSEDPRGGERVGGTLAEDSSVNSNFSKTYKDIVLKGGSEFKLYRSGGGYHGAIEYGTLAKEYNFEGLVVPEDAYFEMSIENHLTKITPAKDWVYNGQTFKAGTPIKIDFKYTYKPEIPIAVKLVGSGNYENDYCDVQGPVNGSYSVSCGFDLIADSTVQGIPLKSGCRIYTDRKDSLYSFECPFPIVYEGVKFKKDAMISFSGANFSSTGCTDSENIKLLDGAFFKGYCISFDKDRKPKSVTSDQNVKVGDRLYFGPVKFNVVNEKLALALGDSYPPLKVEAATLANLPVCVDGSEAPVYESATLKQKAKGKIPNCNKLLFSINGKNYDFFTVKEVNSQFWKIEATQPRFAGDENSEIEYNKDLWIANSGKLSTPIVMSLSGRTFMTPIVLVLIPGEVAGIPLEQRLLFMDKEYFYFRAPKSGECGDYDDAIFKSPIPAGFKIDSKAARTVKPTFKIKYVIEANSCDT